jgi:hypothetical protein
VADLDQRLHSNLGNMVCGTWFASVHAQAATGELPSV